ncbi:MAG: FAD-binding oxidoreductase [Myxococcales bacterium]|nr:FAD-binding oxidoreductase [Myxococcales bacterium]
MDARPLFPLRRKPGAGPEHRRLERELRSDLAGDVRFDSAARALFATDASNYRHVPIGVVTPRSSDDLRRGIAICRRHGAPVLSRGGGTSLAGQSCNAAVIFDTSRYLGGVRDIDPIRRSALVECGAVLDRVREAASEYDLTFGPDPSTHDRCTIGGMLGNNSCGVHALQSEFYGPGPRTEDNLRRMTVLTYDGLELSVGPTSDAEYRANLEAGGRRAEIYRALRDLRDRYAPLIRERFPQIPRRVSGYNLPALLPENGFDVGKALVGSEGTCVWILEAELTLIDAMKHRALLMLGYDDVYQAGDHVSTLRELKPVGMEGFDQTLVDHVKQQRGDTGPLHALPDGNGWLLVEFAGTSPEEARERAQHAQATLRKGAKPPRMNLLTDPGQQAGVWEVRKSALGVTAFVPGEHSAWPGWEDSAVPCERVGEYLRGLTELMQKYEVQAALYGHFGQGCIHCRYTFDLATPQGVETFRRFTDEAADLCLALGGSLSGEHGDGQARADLLPKMYGAELIQAFEEFKQIWDPLGKMNPGKIVGARERTQDLRLAKDELRTDPAVEFGYASDHGSFAHAALRCVGVGECRRESGGVMCPSYQVTRDEMHSTRGRAHMLFEMTKGEVVRDLWQSEEVAEALDLCLSCKGCKSDCPVNVDIATYKAEFLSHYYRGHGRPRHAYAFGLIMYWARLASWLPRLSNLLSHAPGLARIAKWVAGIAPQRTIPRFAPKTFRSWWRRHDKPESTGPRVVLWADTFNNYFLADTLIACVGVLESAGCDVVVLDQTLCCGRPLYDFGMLERARQFWQRNLDALEEELDKDTPLIVAEPSCLAAFRDELPGLLPTDERAQKLSSLSRSLAEFLVEIDFSPPPLESRVLVQGHCHQHAVVGFDAENELFRRMGADVHWPNDGCCGMAGAFGFERDKFKLSEAIASRKLLPALDDANRQAHLCADGFSCREQISQLNGRRPKHLAELISDQLERPLVAAERPRAVSAARALLVLVLVSALCAAACSLL